MKRKISLVMLAISVFLTTSTAYSASHVTAEYTLLDQNAKARSRIGLYSGNYDTEIRYAQTFTALESGFLERITTNAIIQNVESPEEPLRVTLYSLENGYPSQELTHVDLDPVNFNESSDIYNPEVNQFNFYTQEKTVSIEAGIQYAIVYSTPNPNYYGYYQFWFNQTGAYPDGRMIVLQWPENTPLVGTSHDNYQSDTAFQITVNTEAPEALDSDADGISDLQDNCPADANADQADNDADGSGDVCDTNDDNDVILDVSDNCPLLANNSQTDTDGDTIGDECDPDDDNDGVDDSNDNCPFVANENQEDGDADGLGDLCDADRDNDGVYDDADNCPLTPNPLQEDMDNDLIGDTCDDDDDSDSILDVADNCPATGNADQADLDKDNIGDACDSDIDGDGYDNNDDNCLFVTNVGQEDADQDGAGDACDSDKDNDGILNAADNCPFESNPDQSDVDGDAVGDVCDEDFGLDLDGDGIANDLDNCPEVANADQQDWDADNLGDVCDDDLDGDNVQNNIDECQFSLYGAVIDPATGCAIEQLVPCDGPRGIAIEWKNHGKYMSSLAKTSKEFVKQGLITNDERAVLMDAGANSNCGR